MVVSRAYKGIPATICRYESDGFAAAKSRAMEQLKLAATIYVLPQSTTMLAFQAPIAYQRWR